VRIGVNDNEGRRLKNGHGSPIRGLSPVISMPDSVAIMPLSSVPGPNDAKKSEHVIDGGEESV
jgi:hypothetical protein